MHVSIVNIFVKLKKNNQYNDYLWLCTQLKEI